MELLLVEDEQYTRDGIIKFIDWKRLGIKKVYTAEDGLQGVDVARLHLPDIILADVRMPRMNGVEMARRIRTFHPDCELIFISGYSDREYLKSAIHLSALDYISKPLDLNELCIFRHIRTANPELSGHCSGVIRTVIPMFKDILSEL